MRVKAIYLSGNHSRRFYIHITSGGGPEGIYALFSLQADDAVERIKRFVDD